MSLKLVPPVMGFLSSIQGYISHSDIEMSASKKVIWFTVWNVFFATVFSGSVFHQLLIILDLREITGKLAVAVPAQVTQHLRLTHTIYHFRHGMIFKSQNAYQIDHQFIMIQSSISIFYTVGIIFHYICCHNRMDKCVIGTTSDYSSDFQFD
jgi:hypothetical protein